MYHCTECDMSTTFCLVHLNDPTITGCTQKDYLEGRIPWDAIQVEHTVEQLHELGYEFGEKVEQENVKELHENDD